MHPSHTPPAPAPAPASEGVRRPPGRRGAVALVLASFLLCSTAPLLSRSPYADLSGLYTDHLRHAHLTWLFLHKGLDIYRLPFGEAAQGVAYRHPMLQWPHVPYAYPPLPLALFLPYSLAHQYLPLTEVTLARLGILYLLALAHLTFYALLRTLGRLTLANALLAFVAWLLLVRSALQGFYDPVWVGCGAVMVHRMARGRPGPALTWFALASLMSYRAVVLAPLALAALVDAVRGRPWREWPWGPLALAGAAGLVCVALFTFVMPSAAGFREGPMLLQRGDRSLLFVLSASAGALLVALLAADVAVAGVVALCAGLALVDTSQWWHALVLLVAPLAVGAWRPGRAPALARLLLIGWLLIVHTHAWSGSPARLWREVREFAHRSL